MSKITSYMKALLITSIMTSAVLMTVISSNLHADQRAYGGYAPPGYGYGYQRSMPHTYGYRAPQRPGNYPGYSQYSQYGQYQRPAAQAYPQQQGDAGSAGSVKIAGMQFQPATIKVRAGDEVTWMNAANMPHTVTSSNGNELASSQLGSGSVFKHTFAEPGTYTYYCALHPSMSGTVIVE